MTSLTPQTGTPNGQQHCSAALAHTAPNLLQGCNKKHTMLQFTPVCNITSIVDETQGNRGEVGAVLNVIVMLWMHANFDQSWLLEHSNIYSTISELTLFPIFIS